MAVGPRRPREARTRSGRRATTRTPDLMSRVREARERLEPDARKFAQTRARSRQGASWTTWPYTPA